MKTTYIIESWSGEILSYKTHLRDAKYFVEREAPTATIIKLIGYEFGEGIHSYYMVYGPKRMRPYHGFKYITATQYANMFKDRVKMFGNAKFLNSKRGAK